MQAGFVGVWGEWCNTEDLIISWSLPILDLAWAEHLTYLQKISVVKNLKR